MDFVWKIYDNWNLCVNDSSERPLSNSGIFAAVQIVRVEISILNKKFNFGQIFRKIKKLFLCEKYMKIEIYVEMIVQNVLFLTVVDL